MSTTKGTNSKVTTMPKSVIYTSEAVKNTQRSHMENKVYFYVTIYFDRNPRVPNPTPVPAMFTHHQLRVAVERAKANPEDIPVRLPWWDKVKNMLRFWR